MSAEKVYTVQMSRGFIYLDLQRFDSIGPISYDGSFR